MKRGARRRLNAKKEGDDLWGIMRSLPENEGSKSPSDGSVPDRRRPRKKDDRLTESVRSFLTPDFYENIAGRESRVVGEATSFRTDDSEQSKSGAEGESKLSSRNR